MGPVSRQDVQNIVDVARNRIMERAVNRQDLCVLSDTIRNLTTLHTQSQQLLKQSEYQRLQLNRQIVALEARLVNLGNDLKTTQAMISRMATQQRPQQIVMPAPAPQPQQQAPTQYSYYPE